MIEMLTGSSSLLFVFEVGFQKNLIACCFEMLIMVKTCGITHNPRNCGCFFEHAKLSRLLRAGNVGYATTIENIGFAFSVSCDGY